LQNQLKSASKPAQVAVSPISGTPPPVEYQFKPGQSGNPAGRKTAGASLQEWLNRLAEQDLTEAALRRIARDEKLGWTKRAAAERILRLLEAGDLADFAGLLSGEHKLEDLRGLGINTEVVKKFKQKTRKQVTGVGEERQVEEIIEREIELHDRAGADFDRICDRTEGRPRQSVTHDGDLGLRTLEEGATEAGKILADLRKRFGITDEHGEEQEVTP